MSLGRQQRNQRGAPRVDVVLHVKGELVPADFPIRIVNLSQTGVAILCEVRFRAGDRIDLRITSREGRSMRVTADAVHTERYEKTSGFYTTGFKFESAGVDTETAIAELIAAIAPADRP